MTMLKWLRRRRYEARHTPANLVMVLPDWTPLPRWVVWGMRGLLYDLAQTAGWTWSTPVVTRRLTHYVPV